MVASPALFFWSPSGENSPKNKIKKKKKKTLRQTLRGKMRNVWNRGEHGLSQKCVGKKRRGKIKEKERKKKKKKERKDSKEKGEVWLGT